MATVGDGQDTSSLLCRRSSVDPLCFFIFFPVQAGYHGRGLSAEHAKMKAHRASLSTPGPQLEQAGEGGQRPSGLVPGGSAQDALGAKIMWYTHIQAEDRNGAT